MWQISWCFLEPATPGSSLPSSSSLVSSWTACTVQLLLVYSCKSLPAFRNVQVRYLLLPLQMELRDFIPSHVCHCWTFKRRRCTYNGNLNFVCKMWGTSFPQRQAKGNVKNICILKKMLFQPHLGAIVKIRRAMKNLMQSLTSVS